MDKAVNVFSALFKFRPREDTTANENFLTESLVYALRTCPAAARAWVSFITDGRVRPRTIEFETRASHPDFENQSNIYPDISVMGVDQSGKRYGVLVEHKWDAPYSKAQLTRYAKIPIATKKLNLAFVCVKRGDRDSASGFDAPPNVYLTVRRWEEIYSLLKGVKNASSILNEFLTFLTDRGLSPGQPISALDLVAGAKKTPERGSAFRRQMLRYCEKLADEYDWDSIPLRYRNNPIIRDSYGRCDLIFVKDDGWAPAVCLGFYHTINDNRVPLVDKKSGIDFSIRIQASPENRSLDGVLSILRTRISDLQRLGVTVRLKGDPENGNSHTLLMAQKSAQKVIGINEDEEGQIAVIHEELSSWCRALFVKPVITALETLKPYRS